MKQLFLICGIALLASCGKSGEKTFSIKNELDSALKMVNVYQYDESNTDLGAFTIRNIPAGSTSAKNELVFGTQKIELEGWDEDNHFHRLSDIIVLKPTGNTLIIFSYEGISAK